MITTGLVPNMLLLATSLESAQTGITGLLASGVSISQSKGNLSALVTVLSANVTILATTIASWSATSPGLTNPAGGTYYLTNALAIPDIQTTASTASNNINSASDGASTFATLSSSPNLNSFAAEIRNIIVNLENNVYVTIIAAGTAVKNSATAGLNSGQSTALRTIGDFQGPLTDSIASYRNTTSNMLDLVISYDSYRVYAVYSLSSLVLIVLIVLSISMILAKPSSVKGCNLCATPIYILIQLLAILLFLLALVLGDVCTNVFEISPSPIATALGSSGVILNNVFILRNNCTNGVSILQAGINMGYINADNFSLTTLANNQLNSVNFSGIANGFNLGNTIDLSSTPTAKLSVLTSLDLSTLNTTQLDTLQFTTLPSLSNQLGSIFSALGALSTALSPSMITYTPPTAIIATQDAAVTDLRSRILNMQNLITTLTTNGTGTIPLLIAQVGVLSATITSVKSQATALIVKTI